MNRSLPVERNEPQTASLIWPKLWLIAIVLCGVVLSWRIATRAIAHRYAQDDPSAALLWRPADPEALAKLSDDYLVGQGVQKSLSTADSLALRAFRLAPLQDGALRNLGLIADARGRNGQAAAIVTRAGLRSFRDVATQAWLMGNLLSRGDLEAALLHFDALLRIKPDLGGRLFPLLIELLQAPSSTAPLARRLALRPPWRAEGLRYLAGHAADVHPIVAVYRALTGRGTPPTNDEQTALLARLIVDGKYDEARRLWTSFLSSNPIPGVPFDGTFKGLPGATPFNWSFFSGPDVAVELARAESARRTGLFVKFPVGAPAALAEQLLVLPPAGYRFSVRYRIESAAAGAGLAWTIRCVVSGAVLLDMRQRGDAVTPWTAVAAGFTVPTDCPAQWLRLNGRAGDGFGDLTAFYDDVTVAPT